MTGQTGSDAWGPGDTHDIQMRLERLEAEHPRLLRMLRETPAPSASDTAKASDDELLEARVLSIIGASYTRHQSRAGEVVLSEEGLETLIRSTASLTQRGSQEISELRSEIADLRRTQLSADTVRVTVAKVVGAFLGSLAAVAAVVAVLIKVI